MQKNAYMRGGMKNGVSRIRGAGSAVGEFLSHLESAGQSPDTVRSRKYAVEKFSSFLAASGKSFPDADCRTLEGYRASLADGELSEGTVDANMRGLKKFFGFLEGRNLVFDNPFRKIVMHRPKHRSMGTVSESDMGKLLAAASSAAGWGSFRNRAILETLYATGMRCGELLSLKIHDVDLSKNMVRVCGKGKKERMLPLGRHAAGHIGLYLRHTRPALARAGAGHDGAGQGGAGNCDDLWLNIHGEKLDRNSLSLLLRFYRGRAGVSAPVNCHTLRRTCATHMLRNGAHPAVIAELLGHSGLGTLGHYLKISIADLKKEHSRSRPGR